MSTVHVGDEVRIISHSPISTSHPIGSIGVIDYFHNHENDYLHEPSDETIVSVRARMMGDYEIFVTQSYAFSQLEILDNHSYESTEESTLRFPTIDEILTSTYSDAKTMLMNTPFNKEMLIRIALAAIERANEKEQEHMNFESYHDQFKEALRKNLIDIDQWLGEDSIRK